MIKNDQQRGLFITVEGIEGVGKSTNMKFIQEYLEEYGDAEVVVTREPGGTEIAEAIRQVLLSHYQETMSYDTELLLMFAARAQHLATVINPNLAAGKWVLCDRFTDASYAYQGGGRGVPAGRIAQLETWVQSSLRPDLTILLDAPVNIALKRAKRRRQPDRIEREKYIFFKKVRECYLARARKFPKQFQVVNACGPRKAVQEQIKIICDELLAKINRQNSRKNNM